MPQFDFVFPVKIDEYLMNNQTNRIRDKGTAVNRLLCLEMQWVLWQYRQEDKLIVVEERSSHKYGKILY